MALETFGFANSHGISRPLGDFSSGSLVHPGLPHPAPSPLEVSHLLRGLLLPAPCGLLSCRCRPRVFTFRAFPVRTAVTVSGPLPTWHYEALPARGLCAACGASVPLPCPLVAFGVDDGSSSTFRPLGLVSPPSGPCSIRTSVLVTGCLHQPTSRCSPGVHPLQGSSSSWPSPLCSHFVRHSRRRGPVGPGARIPSWCFGSKPSTFRVFRPARPVLPHAFSGSRTNSLLEVFHLAGYASLLRCVVSE